ncbi:Fic family protein [Persicirhabdus sediminis]|uniref:Fic family protein n=1 Tax=Persicirhabdus sediminis TaxID=454144 RepID=A0A8J7MEV9_9BACT|nr:Fic family protein [Persicirhabdus sediminis]MBK1791437.1 Fic family protein [Persicirhabdus sediminis]
MPAIIKNEELELLRDTIHAAMPNGRSISELLDIDQLDYSRRTLQRRLESLVARGEIVARGHSRNIRYITPVFAPEKEHYYGNMLSEDGASYGNPSASSYRASRLEESHAPYSAAADDSWLSDGGLECKKLIARPLAERKAVGYRAEFLHDYQPNQSYYLDEATRAELAELGRVGLNDLPPGTYLRKLLDRMIIEISWNSSRLEGNTYSLLETERLMQHGLSHGGKSTAETQMLLNHKAAIEMLADPSDELGFNRYSLCNLHALLAENLLGEIGAGGRLRRVAVGIGQSVFRPLEIPQQIEENFQLVLEKAAAIDDPFEAAFFVLVQLPYLQPFADVNKRTSRLAANIPMVQHNLCPLSFVDVDTREYLNAVLAVYELNRVDYLRDLFIWAYKRSCTRYNAIRLTLGNPDPFQLKYREQIKNCVRELVQLGAHGEQAKALIAERASQLAPSHEEKSFGQIVAAELAALHVGSIVRYKLRPAEFAKWQSGRES